MGLWILGAGHGHDHGQDLNMRGVWLHVLSDALGSLGAICSGLAIWAFGWRFADPLASLLISALILHAAWQLLRDAVDVLMEMAPRHLDVEEIRAQLAGVPDVLEVHDLHVWTIGNREISLSSHVVTPNGTEPSQLLRRIYDLLGSQFGIDHATIQIEHERFSDESPRSVAHTCIGACEPAAAAPPDAAVQSAGR